jgi:SsrA-binding protein
MASAGVKRNVNIGAKPKTKVSRGQGVVAENKRAFFNYDIEERFEAGLVLNGWEVKSARQGKLQLTDGYVLIREGELFLMGCQIQTLTTTSTHYSAEMLRTKKLLMHQAQIQRLAGKVQQKGYALVALNIHWKNGKLKCELALARGKQAHDKRQTLKDRESKRQVERLMKSQTR